MAFFDQEHYLQGLSSMGEMQMIEDAPRFSPSGSSETRKLTITLADIPEATPGPNAFAQQAARMQKHRLDGNAFYQQEVQRRKATPPTGTHPALRMRSVSDLSSPPRDSTCTTMSLLINGGQEMPRSPQLTLVPSHANLAEPTRRGHIEERREQFVHDQSGSNDERTPVFIPTLKIASTDFAKSTGTPRKRVEKENFVSQLPVKTPKKSLLERLKTTTNLRGSPSPSTTLASPEEFQADSSVPVKAQAVLGKSSSKGRVSLSSSPPKANIPRSPSKRKGFFGRKSTGLADVNPSKPSLAQTSPESECAPPTASSITKTPQTAYSDPTHYSYQSTRNASQKHSDQSAQKGNNSNKCAVVRTQSLKYFDHTIPPTPPAKNTPPHERAQADAALAKKSSRVPFHDTDTTPSKHAAGLICTNERLSPTKFGSYGHREIPTLVTKPSLYSLHASVVPDLIEASTFEEMKARCDGLGLEGFSMPTENMRSPTSQQVYSPSIYSNEWVPRPNSAFATRSPPMQQMACHSHTPSFKTKTSSSGGTIPVCYPELASDPSVGDLTPMLTVDMDQERHGRRGRQWLDPKIALHGRTHSHDHSNSPRHSVDSSIFAHRVEDDLRGKVYDSPTSFSHPSATPSPLQTLPATAYTPPRRKSSKRQNFDQTPSDRLSVPREAHHNALGIRGAGSSESRSPSRCKELFEDAPYLPADSGGASGRSPSPQSGVIANTFDDDVDVDPRKRSVATNPSGDKLDRMIEMLDKLNTRNNEITSMRDEMRASNARLDERLAAVENLRVSSRSPSLTTDETASSSGEQQHLHRSRVPTEVAHNFYRLGQASNGSAGDTTGEDETKGPEVDTVAELKATNRRLMEMIGGFGAKIEALEKKVGGDA